MRFEEIANSPKERLKKILETLHKEHNLSLNFKNLKKLDSLKRAAIKTIEEAKNNSNSVFEGKDTKLELSYLIIEAIKINKEINMSKKKINEEQSIQKAEYLLASKDIVDTIQGFVEKVSDIQAQKIPAIVDVMKLDVGIDSAEAYKTTAGSLISALIDSLNSAKDGMDNLTLGLSGDVDMASAAPAEPTPAETPAGTEEPTDELAPEKEPELPANPLGRERKEESKKISGEKLNESKKWLITIHDTATLAHEKPKVIVSTEVEAATPKEAMSKVKAEVKAKRHIKNAFPKEWETSYKPVNESTKTKKWHVKVIESGKIIANNKVTANTFAEASTKMKNALIKQRGLKEWNQNFEIIVKPISESMAKDTKFSAVSRGSGIYKVIGKPSGSVHGRYSSMESAEKAAKEMNQKMSNKDLKESVKEQDGIPSELKVWNVKATSPKGDKLFGNFRVYAPIDGLAVAKAKKAVEKKHGNVEVVYSIAEMNKDSKVPTNESWGEKMNTAEKDKGKWTGWTKQELEHELSTLKKKKEHSAEDIKVIRQIEFALRAKGKGKKHTGKWGKVKESVNDVEMMKNSLNTIIRVSKELEDALGSNDEMPEWAVEKLGRVKGMITGLTDYVISKKEQNPQPSDESIYTDSTLLAFGQGAPKAPSFAMESDEDEYDYNTPEGFIKSTATLIKNRNNRAEAKKLAYHYANGFEKEHPNFNKKEYLAACGVTESKVSKKKSKISEADFEKDFDANGNQINAPKKDSIFSDHIHELAKDVRLNAEALAKEKGIKVEAAVDEIINRYSTTKKYASEIKALIMGGLAESPNSSQTLTAQQKPMPSMFKSSNAQLPATDTTGKPTSSQKPTGVPPQKLNPGDEVMHNGQKVTVDSDNGTTVGIKTGPNAPVQMVSKDQIEQQKTNESSSKNSYNDWKRKMVSKGAMLKINKDSTIATKDGKEIGAWHHNPSKEKTNEASYQQLIKDTKELNFRLKKYEKYLKDAQKLGNKDKEQYYLSVIDGTKEQLDRMQKELTNEDLNATFKMPTGNQPQKKVMPLKPGVKTMMQGNKPVIVDDADNKDPNSSTIKVRDAAGAPPRSLPKNQLTDKPDGVNDEGFSTQKSNESIDENEKNARKIRMSIETHKGQKGYKTFECEDHAKEWIKANGHNVKHFHKIEGLEEDVVQFIGNKKPVFQRNKSAKIIEPNFKHRNHNANDFDICKTCGNDDFECICETAKMKEADYRVSDLPSRNKKEVKHKLAKCREVLANAIKNKESEGKISNYKYEVEELENILKYMFKVNEMAAAGSTVAGAIAQIPQPLFKKPKKRVEEDDTNLEFKVIVDDGIDKKNVKVFAKNEDEAERKALLHAKAHWGSSNWKCRATNQVKKD